MGLLNRQILLAWDLVPVYDTGRICGWSLRRGSNPHGKTLGWQPTEQTVEGHNNRTYRLNIHTPFPAYATRGQSGSDFKRGLLRINPSSASHQGVLSSNSAD